MDGGIEYMVVKNVQVRVDEDLKKQVDKIYENLGTTTNEAIKIFMKASIRAEGFPFPVNLKAKLSQEK